MTYRPSRETIRKAMQSAPVREALRARADDIAARANSIGAGEGVDFNAKVEEGTRPQGRPFAQAYSHMWQQEWGTTLEGRKRIMGRAAGK